MKALRSTQRVRENSDSIPVLKKLKTIYSILQILQMFIITVKTYNPVANIKHNKNIIST